MKDIDEITGDVLDLSLRIHKDLRPGLFESVYETILGGKFADKRHVINRQRPIDRIDSEC